MQILAALFLDAIDTRQVPGPSTRLDLTGVQFSTPAPTTPPFRLEPHLCVIVSCGPQDKPQAALEVVFRRGGEQIARNVQALAIEPGRFGFRLVRAELEFEDYGLVEAHCRVDLGTPVIVPLTVLPPVG